MVMSSRVFQPRWIDIDPGVAQANRLDLLAVLADDAVQQRKDIVSAFIP